MMKTKQYINKNYPSNLKSRAKITHLDLRNQDLEGDFDLSDFVNLVSLDCSNNSLLDIKFIATIKHPEKLLYLNLRNNCFLPNKLEIFTNFCQVEELYLGTTDVSKVSSRIYNQFYGSLKPLENLKKLKTL